MSGNWDDSDTDSEVVEVVEKPIILPRSRQPSVAKSLEKATILENSIAGSFDNDDDDESDDNVSIGTTESGDLDLLDEGATLYLDFDNTTKMRRIISQFHCSYRNIIAEFADIEIFLISLDSLVVEFLSHRYHNYQLAGQSLVLTTQIDRFLQQFINLGGKFKLVVFTDFANLFSRDTTVSFARSVAIAHIASGPFAKDLAYFHSPIDPEWHKFLRNLTPSFLMISYDNFTKDACAQDDLDISPQLQTIVIDTLSNAISVVPLTSIVVNFASVEAYMISPKLCVLQNWETFVEAHWDCSGQMLKNAKNPSFDGSSLKDTTGLWVAIINEAKKGTCSDNFDALACAVLLSSLVCKHRGASRIYLEEREGGKRGLDVIRDRRTLLTTAVAFLDKLDFANSKLSVSDIWDGRMVLTLFDYIVANETVLPYRLQEEFAKLHTSCSLKLPLAADTAEKLFEPSPQPADPLTILPILYSTESALIDSFVPEMKTASSNDKVVEGLVKDFAEICVEKLHWKLRPIEEDFAKKKTDPQTQTLEDVRQLKRANKSRQFMSRWYEMFANSLEGRGSNLLVDFSRTPRFAPKEEENNDQKKGKGGWAGQKGQKGGGNKKGKEPVKSKKELILEANKKAKDQKIIESESAKIKFACQQGTHAIAFLENLMPTLDLPETKALCVYEIILRESRTLLADWAGSRKMMERRTQCVSFVGRLKECFVKYWPYLQDKQKDMVVDLWVHLGFVAPKGSKPSSEAKTKKLDLGMNMLYYQLEYGGELIDIQSDPQKDERVTGFAPDAWQRSMLDSVDRGNSAVIVAPTSAGKTFVSYYCIEKVLRQSDVDVVVYVSPSKALMNQVCGSIYARFKNKSMARGRALFGTLTPEYDMNALNCQVLVTVPESLEMLLLSTNPAVQEFSSHIRYVVFDEVHSIGASEEAHIWEHLLLLINCPFLALSATIGNGDKLHQWLNSAEIMKSLNKRKVDMIIYGERYSELELSIMSIDKPAPIEVATSEENGSPAKEDKIESGPILKPLMPYGVFMPEKLRMFGIPDDQQLTARQILQLYTIMASVDEKTKNEFEPCHYFGYKESEFVWLSRASLRQLENKLKKRLLEWLETDEALMNKTLQKLGGDIQDQLEYRSVPFNKEKVAADYIVKLVDEMRDNAMLPAICFNDDRHVCEDLAFKLCETLEEREREFTETAEFRNKYAIKDEEKIMKAARRRRDAAEKKKKGDKPDDEPQEEVEDDDPLASQRAKLKQVLARFKLRGRGGDPDVYEKMVERMSKSAKNRESTKLLLRLFERGIGFHHAGLNMAEKGAVEVLFRSGNLAILFSTSTLALGVNMPCKTVMFGVDTPMLTPLLYRQMSGRAGRRGFDHSGSVIFMSVPTSKMRRLLTASLSNLQGNPPFTTSFLLRLMAFVHQPDVSSVETGKPITSIQQRTRIALSLVKNSFSLFTRSEAASGVLQKQLQMYLAYSVQLLRHLQLLDVNCAAKNLAGLVAALQENEPGNLVFAHLLQRGVFHRLIKKYQESSKKHELKQKVLTVLAHIFTRERLPPSYNPNDRTTFPASEKASALIFLPPLPEEVRKCLEEYNIMAVELYHKFMAAASPYKQLLDPAFFISGNASESGLMQRDDLVSPVFNQYSHDSKFLPVVDIDHVDHRGRKIYYNAFVIDFFNNPSRESLVKVNALHVNTMWFLLHDFNEILHTLANGLDVVARPQDPVAEVVRELYHDFDSKFRSAFGMRHRD